MCKDCGVHIASTRIKRSFIERHITHKSKYKYYCPNCKRTVFVSIGGTPETQKQ